MKKAIFFLILLMSIPFFSFSQSGFKEFEGIIKYKHEVVAKENSYDVEYDYSAIGKQSEYYFKNGDYKFVNHDSYFKADLYKSNELRNYLILEKSDTVFSLNSRVADIEIVDFEIKKSATIILGYHCDLLTLKLKPVGGETPISYRRYYFAQKLSIDPSHFKSCKANAYDFIFEKAKALPLQIEFEWPNKLIRWKAYDVVNQKLDADFFEKQKTWILTEIK